MVNLGLEWDGLKKRVQNSLYSLKQTFSKDEVKIKNFSQKIFVHTLKTVNGREFWHQAKNKTKKSKD